MRRQWILAALGAALLCTGGIGCKKESTVSGGAPSGRKGQMQTVNQDTMTSPVDQASGAAATKRPLPATQPSAAPATQAATKP